MATTSNVDVVRALGKLDDALLEVRGVVDGARLGELRRLAHDGAEQARATFGEVGPDDVAAVFLLVSPDLRPEERAAFTRALTAALAPPRPVLPVDVCRIALRRVPR